MTMLHWIQHHGFDCLLFYFLFNCLVSPMPTPSSKSSGFYLYIYGVLHGILQLAAGNLARLPGIGPMLLADMNGMNGKPPTSA